MIFDKLLMFADNESLTGFTSGTIGKAIDLGAAGQGKGRAAYVAVVAAEDTTATGAADVTFALETGEKEDFSDAAKIPLSLPPLKKEDLAKGAVWIAPVPLYIKRFVRLSGESSADLACAGISAGFVLDPQL